MLQRAGRLHDAVAEYRVAMGFHEKAISRFPTEVKLRTRLLSIRAELAALLESLGNRPEAATLLQEQLQDLRAGVGGDSAEVATACAWTARALLTAGMSADAELLSRKCLTIREKQIPDDWLAFNARSILGASLIGQKRYTEAEPFLISGYEGMKQREEKIPAAGKLRLKEAVQYLVQLYEATNRSDQAAEWKQKLAEFEKEQTSPALKEVAK